MKYEDIQRKLQRRREELRTRANRVKGDLRHEQDPLVADFAEQAIQRSNDEVLSAIQSSAEDELRHIDVALRRIADDTYDTCSHCGEPIAAERLAAVPYTDLCRKCASTPSGRN